jgi:hypothetical protein
MYQQLFLIGLSVAILGFPHKIDASPNEILGNAISRCEVWMSDVDDNAVASEWPLSYINVVPNSEGGVGEVTKEFHHPNWNIVVQIGHRPVSGNRGCSVISNVTAFDNLNDEGLRTIQSDRARQVISSWMERSGQQPLYDIIPKVGLFDVSLLRCSSTTNFIIGSVTESGSVSEYLPWMVAFSRDHDTQRRCEN